MPDSLATQLLHSDLEVPCPRCEYPIWVRWSEVVVQQTVLCPCCRIRVGLVDDRGGMQMAGNDIERHINDALKGLFE